MAENRHGNRMPGWLLLSVSPILWLAVAAGCGGGSGSGGSNPPPLTPLSVVALYPTHGANWNDYVKNDGASVFNSSGAAADGSETGGFRTVLHGGEMRAVQVTGKSTCAGLTAQDDLGAFDWTCLEGSAPVRMVSTGLKDGKYLSSLVDFRTGAWRTNKVTVYADGAAYGASSPAAWWANRVVLDNDGSSGSDMASGDVRLVSRNPQATYTFGADKVALVIDPTVTATGSAATGETIVAADAKRFLWFEGTINGEGDQLGVYWEGVNFSVLRNVTVADVTGGLWQAGVILWGSSFNRVRDISTRNTKSRGFALETGSNYNEVRGVRCASDGWLDVIEVSESQHNYLENIVAIQSRQIGLYLFRASYNVLIDVVVNNNHSFGLDVGEESSHNTLINVTAANNGSEGLRIYSASLDNVVLNLTAANNGDGGVNVFGITTVSPAELPTNNVLMNAVAVNSNIGFYLYNRADNNRFVNITAASQAGGMRLDSVSGNAFSGLLRVGSNSAWNCSVVGGTNPGLANGTCANNGQSDAVLTTGISLAASLVAKVMANDTQNPSDSSGAAAFSTITDWTSFEHPLRMWGRDGTAAFPHVSNTGFCGAGGATEACRIWDWSLRAGDTGGGSGAPAILGVLVLPTGNDTFLHTWSAGSSTRALRNAVELVGDGVGNDNGLCESGESCLYTPNIGRYQGHGRLVSAGTFVNGAVTGVTLWRYETNGR